MYVVKMANGRKLEADTLAAAIVIASDEVGGDEFRCGHDGDLSHGGDRTLFWASEADARNDDGARAAGSIVKVSAGPPDA